MAQEHQVQSVLLDSEVYILPFKYKLLPALVELNEARNNVMEVDITMKNLPKIGYIAFLGKTPIAAGFLRRVEPNYAQFDTFLSNPFFGSQIRHLALSKIVDALTEDANNLDLAGVLAFTKDESIFKRAKDQGFQVVEQVILSKRFK